MKKVVDNKHDNDEKEGLLLKIKDDIFDKHGSSSGPRPGPSSGGKGKGKGGGSSISSGHTSKHDKEGMDDKDSGGFDHVKDSIHGFFRKKKDDKHFLLM